MAADAVSREARRRQSSDYLRASFTENLRASALSTPPLLTLTEHRLGNMGARDHKRETGGVNILEQKSRDAF